ncbi:hypothetical protein K0T92_12105 [Paenibacillus oenotherae]|uniref:Lipoprotein n=1 Tax=Paenibacillus oenotherae TaxID=1435645 RepID=A0ABS7D6M8_9BACL|nr:hypothetical protein [Paenibacillus oenotherae]MBW7475494.1 hypothetical protein [Paenibacillus oenotherae]
MNNKLKGMQLFIRTLVVATTLAAAVGACSNEGDPVPSQSEQSTPDNKEGTPVVAEQPTGQLTDEEAQSLEQIATEDAEKYMVALKREDAEALSRLMAHAENENVPETMKVVIEGFRLHFDNLADLKLSLKSNQQTEEYFIENFILTGMRDGEERAIPFQVKYAKKGGIAALLSGDTREPLYDSPYIGQYPYAVRDAGRYVQALIQKDVDSAALHLGLDESKKEVRAAVQQMLQVYAEKLDLSAAKIIPLGYDAANKQFLFDLQDGKKRVHSIQLGADTFHIQDNWATVKAVPEDSAANDFALSVNDSAITLKAWDYDVNLDKILGAPLSSQVEQLGEGADTSTGSFMKRMKYDGLQLELFSPKNNGKHFWIMTMEITKEGYQTSRGIELGHTVKAITDAYPAIQIAPDGRTDPNNCAYEVKDEDQGSFLKLEVKEGVVSGIKIYHLIP